MKRVQFEIDGVDFEFFCESRDTRHGFAHDAYMWQNNWQAGEGHAYWCNRTWERWTYETACKDACYRRLARRIETLRDEYKREHNISRITQKRKAELESVCKSDPDVVLMRKVIAHLSEKCY